MSKAKLTQHEIDIKNLRFYAEMAQEFKWETDVIHWSVVQQTLKEIADRISAAPDLHEALKGLLADIHDYQRVNNLGGENNHRQVAARAALEKGERPMTDCGRTAGGRMSEARHSPGPWKACHDGKCQCRQVWTIPGDIPVFSAQGRNVGAVHQKMADDPETVYAEMSPAEAEANCRLVVVAPDLLWCLKRIMEDIPQHRDWLDPVLEDIAKKCIAIAEGRA